MEAKRRQRAYKVKDKYYDKAIKRAKKEKEYLAQLVELFVISYGDGATIIFDKIK